MFRNKKKVEFSDEEYRFILYALTDFRNELLKENKYTDAIDDAMVALKNKVKADKYFYGTVVNVLYEKRKVMLEQNEDTEMVDKLLLRLVDIYEKF